MNTKRLVLIVRWLTVFAALAAIVSFNLFIIHANTTTAALTLLLFILVLATQWGLRYAVVASFAAAACYNFFFLPPLNTFTINDAQNWLALFTFLVTAVIASRLSERLRDESADAHSRQSELGILYRLSRELLQTENVAEVINSVPLSVLTATEAMTVVLYLLDGDKLYFAGDDWRPHTAIEEWRDLSHTSTPSRRGDRSFIPLLSGVRPRGLLALQNVSFSEQTMEALGGLISITLERAQALEDVARGEANKESERLRGLMLDSITHELRTPLTSIKASVSTLLTTSMPADETQELLTVIDEESDRLNRLVAQAVEMAQLDTQAVRMTFVPHTVRQMVDRAITALEPALQDHPVTITLPENLRPVLADGLWIEKVLGNLLENAAKYSAPQKPVFVSAEQTSEGVTISIADRGTGIDPMEQTLIFDKFYRARAQRQLVSGTGMGLAICRAILEAHGGKLTVTSRVGEGSVFTFSLRSAAA